MSSHIFVTKPYLPPLEELMPSLEAIWSKGILTNGGPFHEEFEAALRDYLGVDHISLFANGTLALVTALQALRVSGEIITTPFSFVATAHAALWNGITPIFVDIDAETLNIDPSRIEAAITPRTTAILPVHCYGNACAVDDIQRIADIYNLKVVYDAAHAFGVRVGDRSIATFGDLSVLSFHATKVFNTFEGGAIVSHDQKTKTRIDHLKNFGFVDETTVVAPGINGKMNEFSAALGLVQLRHIDNAIAERQALVDRYIAALQSIPGIRPVFQNAVTVPNFAYFPILVTPEYPIDRDELYQKLRTNNIYARRYFFPLISEFPMYRSLPSAAQSNLPNATRISRSILCLPLYPSLSLDDQDHIVDILANL